MSFQEKIRNFAIISHIDHGKSTLADRFLEITNTISKDKMQAQFLDQMDLERERGITIKLQPVRMIYKMKNPKSETDSEYILNLIDTPGHVDFNYEVSRSLAAVEGAVLLVDATQGIQAQTLANLHLALDQKLTIIPVINKIDMPSAKVEEAEEELSKLLNIDKKEILRCSAKLGTGVDEILKRIVEKVPPPLENTEKPLRALVFDSEFDEYKGVIAYVRVFDGQVKKGDKINFFATQKEADGLEVGIFIPKLLSKDILRAGEIGYIATGLKEIEKCKVGDTIFSLNSEIMPLQGYKEIKPMVFAGIYCKQGSDFQKLRNSIEKLKLNDASLSFEPESSPALGYGFRAGFLGMLHLEIIQERLRREYNLDLIITTPSVAYKIKLKTGKQIIIKSPQEFPDPSEILYVEEPQMKIEIITPSQFMGRVMDLIKEKRGDFISSQYLTFGAAGQEKRLILEYLIPLSSLLYDFYDKLKTVSSGYASLNYEFFDYQKVELVKVDILVASEKVEPLTILVYKDRSYQAARRIVEALKDVLPRQMFEVKIQAAIGGKIIASERISAMRKDVLAKLYGGDVTRKMKLLEKQKKGKKKMKTMGKVDIPPEAYIAVLK